MMVSLPKLCPGSLLMYSNVVQRHAVPWLVISVGEMKITFMQVGRVFYGNRDIIESFIEEGIWMIVC